MDADIKGQARAAAFGVRKAAFAAQGDAGARACGHLSDVLAAFAGQVLAGYMPMRTEIDPLPAMHQFDGPLCVPVIVAKDTPLVFAAYNAGADMVAGAFGALVPKDAPLIVPRVLIVPLLAYDARGYRLGYGGGFYDRTLQMLRAQGEVTAIGFGFAAQGVAAVPTDSFDEPLDVMVTDAGITRF